MKNDFDGNIFKPAMFVNVMIENYIAYLYSVRNTIIFAGSMNLCKFKAWFACATMFIDMKIFSP